MRLNLRQFCKRNFSIFNIAAKQFLFFLQPADRLQAHCLFFFAAVCNAASFCLFLVGPYTRKHCYHMRIFFKNTAVDALRLSPGKPL